MKSFKAVGIQKRFEGVVALKNASIQFDGAKICGLVGANGSGKTTFARICCGLIPRDAGELFIDGSPAHITSPFDANDLGIVLAHQNLSLIPDLTVWENIKLGHEKKKRIFLDNDSAREEAESILEELVPGEISIEKRIEDLSPAHKQLVEIAKALSQKPQLLILDEPTAALEYFHVEQLFKKVFELRDSGTSIIFISHRLWEITRLCDLVFAFRNGEYAGTVDFSESSRDESLIVPLVTGEGRADKISFARKMKKDYSGVPVCLEAANLNYGKKLQNINFSAKKGEVIGIAGLNGQGQEELIMALAGAIPIKSGSIKIEDKKVHLSHPGKAIREGVYLVPGDRLVDGLFPSHSVFNNSVFPRFTLKSDKSVLNFNKLNSITDDIIAQVELNPPDRSMMVLNLSGGNQQKVVFGRWLQFKPRVLLLNDPAKGIDIQAKDSLYKLVHELSEAGTTVVLYASSNEELINHCDRVFVMFEGRIVEEFGYETISDDNLVKSSLRVEVET